MTRSSDPFRLDSRPVSSRIERDRSMFLRAIRTTRRPSGPLADLTLLGRALDGLVGSPGRPELVPTPSPSLARGSATPPVQGISMPSAPTHAEKR